MLRERRTPPRLLCDGSGARICAMIRCMKTVRMPCGDVVPALGQGTWTMGEDRALRAQEIASLRAGPGSAACA